MSVKFKECIKTKRMDFYNLVRFDNVNNKYNLRQDLNLELPICLFGNYVVKTYIVNKNSEEAYCAFYHYGKRIMYPNTTIERAA